MKRTTPKQYEALSVKLGELISRERNSLGLTQDQLSELAGVSRSGIWQIENARYKDFSLCVVLALLDAMGVDIGDFFNELFK